MCVCALLTPVRLSLLGLYPALPVKTDRLCVCVCLCVRARVYVIKIEHVKGGLDICNIRDFTSWSVRYKIIRVS